MDYLTLCKIAPFCLLVLLACPLAESSVTANYSFIRDMTVTPLAVDGNTVTVSVTFDIYFTPQAWSTFRYASGSFPYMSAWWQSQVGNTFSYDGFSGKLLSIQWTLLGHYVDYDRLNAVAKIQIL